MKIALGVSGGIAAYKAAEVVRLLQDRGIRVATLSCHGNPVHPDTRHAAKDVDTFRKTVRLAEILDIKVIVGFLLAIPLTSKSLVTLVSIPF